MHQQIRTILGRSGVSDGSGAMSHVPVEGDPVEIEDGALDHLLDLLARHDYNLCLAGGRAIEGDGEFVFAIDHEEGEERTAECAAMLAAEGYRQVRVLSPHVAWVDDKPGALRDSLLELGEQGREIREVFVGTPKEGKVLIHVSTVRRSPKGGAHRPS
jgi:hypothetical protein